MSKSPGSPSQEALSESAVSRGIDHIEVTFDEPNLVANAGLLLVATLVVRLGLERLINTTVHLSGRVGGARPGRKVLTLVHAMAAGGSHIDHAEMLRSGATGSVLGHRVMAQHALDGLTATSSLRPTRVGRIGAPGSCRRRTRWAAASLLLRQGAALTHVGAALAHPGGPNSTMMGSWDRMLWRASPGTWRSVSVHRRSWLCHLVPGRAIGRGRPSLG